MVDTVINESGKRNNGYYCIVDAYFSNDIWNINLDCLHPNINNTMVEDSYGFVSIVPRFVHETLLL